MMRAFTKVERGGEEQLRRFGLTMGQFDVLAQVGASEGMSQAQLAESLLVTKGNVAQLLGKMEVRGVISRRSEGRTKRVCLTPEGRDLYRKVVPAHEEYIAGKLSALPEEDLKTLHELLRRLDRGIE